MANNAILKAAIADVIKTNGTNEITGALLQQSLLAIIDALGNGFQYNGVATPQTQPGTPDQNIFYLVFGPATFENFGSSFTLFKNDIAIVKYNGTWALEYVSFASRIMIPGQDRSDVYESAIADFMVDEKLVEPNGILGVWSYGSVGDFLAVNFVNSENQMVWASFGGSKLLTDVQDWEIVEIRATLAGGNVAVGDLIGYIIFKDLATFRANPTGSQSGNHANISRVCKPQTIIDNLVSDLACIPLSARQGKILAQQISNVATNIGGSLSVLQTILDDVYKPQPVVKYQLENDLDFFTSDFYGYKNIGQYTKVFDNDTYCSAVRINKIKCEYGGNVNYKIYLVKGLASLGYREAPVISSSGAAISSAQEYTLLKSGTFEITTEFADYVINLGQLVQIPAGFQVVVQMAHASRIDMRGVSYGAGNSEETSNASYLCVRDNPLDENTVWCPGTVIESQNIGYFNVALTLLSVVPVEGATVADVVNSPLFQEKVEEIIDEQEQINLKIQIPNVVYAVVGTELNIWNDSISLSADKGLESPINYQINWVCAKGKIMQRGFRFTPEAGDIGNVQCTCQLYDTQYNLIATKTFTIKVLAKNALASAKHIVYFGDSTGAEAAQKLYDIFHNAEKFTGVAPIMCGSMGTTPKYDAVGGYSWADYATAGRRAFRCQVTGVGAIALNSQYTNNGFTWTVVEVNTTGGTGNILITKYDVGGTDAPQTNGTLVPVGSGDSIQYTNATLQGANPLWNENTNSLDVALYRSRIGLSEKLDAVSFQLGLNAPTTSPTTIKNYITALYDAFIADNPNCIFILGLVTSAGNTLDGFGANYGASFNAFTSLRAFYDERELYLSLLSDSHFSKLRIATPHLSLDRYFGYQFGVRNISQRFEGVTLPDELSLAAKEVYHTNWVHPAVSGYGQMADAFFAAYVSALTE